MTWTAAGYTGTVTPYLSGYTWVIQWPTPENATIPEHARELSQADATAELLAQMRAMGLDPVPA